MLGMIGLAAALPVRDAGVPAATTRATLNWLVCVHDFAAVASAPTEAAAETMLARLKSTTALDPGFSTAWTDGAIMLRVLDGPVGDRTSAFVAAGRTQRPDLPWARVAPEHR